MRSIEQREDAIRLYLEEHLSYRDVAVRLNVPRDTVKSWIRRYRDAKNLIVDGTRQRRKKGLDSAKKLSAQGYEKRIQQLEMEVELLRDFLSEEERRSIKK
jgi:transposase